MATHNIVFFGDQSVDPEVSLKDLLAEARRSDLVSSFLRSAFEELQAYTSLLPSPEKDLFQGQDFSALLGNINRRNIKHVAVTTVLSYVTQLGWLLRHRETNAQTWLHGDSLTVLGVCTGTLAAVAAVAALSDSDLLTVSRALLPVALRVGIEVSRRSRAIEATSAASWSVAVSGVSVESIKAEVKLFNEAKHLPPIKQIYISAYSQLSVTLSGPPSLLQTFTASEALAKSRKLPLPIYGAFHAEHLRLPDSELDAILGDSTILDRSVPFMSSLIHPRDYRHDTLRDILRAAVKEILQEPLDIEDDILRLRWATTRRQNGPVALTSIGPARIRALEKALSPSHVERLGSRQLHQKPAQECASTESRDAIAIVGMSGRFPGADNVDELWKLLMEGSDQHRIVPSDRFDVKTHVDPTGKVKNTSLTPYGCFYDRVADFDISLFKISPREAAQTDPGQRLMLLTAYEALESAGYSDSGDPDASRPRHGTFYGVAGDDYRQANSSQDVDVNYITGGTRAFGPGRVSYYFGWEGPSTTVDAACSASGVAMHQAIASLKQRDCDVALAGGANLLTCSDMFAGLSRAKFVNATGPCKTFDEGADGYCRADGFATVVFKRLGDAVREKDNILGVVRAIETKHAGTAISLTHPEADTQTALFRSVLASAGLTVDDVDHIELHGTGTQAGDLAEATSVTGLLDKPRPAHRPLTIASVKPNVGHSEAASGVTSLIKGLLMLQNETIPAHVGIKTRVNPKLPNMDAFGVVIPRENMDYRSGQGHTRRMLVNNFNATGGITALLLEEYKGQGEIETKDTRRNVAYPITLSAATLGSLSSMKTRLASYLEENPNTRISDLSYTLTARRLHHKHRFAVAGRSVSDIVSHLRSEATPSAARQPINPLHVFVFTGQTGLLPRAQVLYQSNKMFRQHMDRSEQLCVEMGLPSFVDILSAEGQQASSYRPVQVQLCLVSLQVGMARLFESYGVRLGAVIGHSLGEYAALCVASVLSLTDMLWLVGKRGLLLESGCEMNGYAMAVLNISAAATREHLKTFPQCDVSCLNSPLQTVVSGPTAEIDRLFTHFASSGVKAKKLQTPYGFHSTQMDPILSDYFRTASSVCFQKPTVPVASTLLGQVIEDTECLNADYLCRQTREPVRFQDALQELETFIGVDAAAVWIEFGATPACLPMIASTLQADPSRLVATMEQNVDNWTSVGKALTKLYLNNGTIRWDEYHSEYLDSVQMLQLPSYPFDLKKYWIQYEGDWIIRKNQTVIGGVEQAPKIQLESSTLHAVLGDSTEQGTRKLVFRTDAKLLEKHQIISSSYISEALFADMAREAATHVLRVAGEDVPAVEISEFEAPVKWSPEAVPSLRTTAIRQPSDTNVIQITIIPDDGSAAPTTYARCCIVLSGGTAASVQANSNAYLYQSRMDLLQLFTANGQCSRMSRPEVRKILALEKQPSLLDDVLISHGSLEGTASINVSEKAKPALEPAWTNALLQLPQLVFGAGHHLKCSGWSKLNQLVTPRQGQTYRAHTRMQPVGTSGSFQGDVHVIDGAGKAVTVISGLLFTPDASGPSNLLNQPTWQIPITGKPSEAARRMSDDTSVSSSVSGDDKDECGQGSDTTVSSPDMHHTAGKLDMGDPKPYDLDAQPGKDVLDKPVSSAGGASFDAVLEILASEIGVPVDELADDVALEDLGVDSIIQISIVARLQESLKIALSPTFLVDNNTVPKLRVFFDSCRA